MPTEAATADTARFLGIGKYLRNRPAFRGYLSKLERIPIGRRLTPCFRCPIGSINALPVDQLPARSMRRFLVLGRTSGQSSSSHWLRDDAFSIQGKVHILDRTSPHAWKPAKRLICSLVLVSLSRALSWRTKQCKQFKSVLAYGLKLFAFIGDTDKTAVRCSFVGRNASNHGSHPVPRIWEPIRANQL